MIPLVLAAAFGAAKLNECRFFCLNQRWKDQRAFDTVRCSIDLSWYFEHVKSHQTALVSRFSALHAQNAEGMQKCLDLHKEIPFTNSPVQLIAKIRRSWAMRANFQELNRVINAAGDRSEPLLLAQTPHRYSAKRSPVEQTVIGNWTFLGRCTTHWWLTHISDFRSQAFLNCIGQFNRSQLDDLNAQMRVLYSRAVEQVWGQMVKGSERLVTAMALLQIGFLGSVPLSLGSTILAHCSKRINAQIVAKVFLASSRFFGVSSLLFALAMGLTIRSYGQLLRRGEERIKAIDKVKELMLLALHQVREQRFQELVELGLQGLKQREKILGKMGRRIARSAERLNRDEQNIEELKSENAEQQLHLKDHAKQIADQAKQFSEQEQKLSAQKSRFSEQTSKLSEQTSKLNEQTSKLNEQKSELSKQAEIIDALIKRLDALESPQSAPAS